MGVAELPIPLDRDQIAEICRAGHLQIESVVCSRPNRYIEAAVRREAIPIYERA